MALDNLKIPETANKSQDVTGLITRPSNSPQINNAKFELLVKNVMRKAFNDLIDGITSLFSNKIVGEIKALGGSAVPSGTLLCDGSAVSRTTYARLFAAIGTTWGGGDGSTTFNLPNLPGKTLIGAGTANGVTYTLGSSGGSKDAVIVSHSHDRILINGDPAYPFGMDGGSVAGGRPIIGNSAQTNFFPAKTSSSGVDGTDKNMQPYSVINYVIVY